MRLSARVEVDIVANNPARQQAARNWGGGVGAGEYGAGRTAVRVDDPLRRLRPDQARTARRRRRGGRDRAPRGQRQEHEEAAAAAHGETFGAGRWPATPRSRVARSSCDEAAESEHTTPTPAGVLHIAPVPTGLADGLALAVQALLADHRKTRPKQFGFPAPRGGNAGD